MAKRKSRSRAKQTPNFAALLRPEVIGSVLVVLALLTLLSLLASRRSSSVGQFVSWLQLLFGIGVWLVPVVFGALGLYLVLRQITDQQVLSGRRIAGVLLLFVVFDGLAHLLSAQDPLDAWLPDLARQQGGVLGWLVSYPLIHTLLPSAAAAALLMLVGLFGLYVVSGLSPVEIGEGVSRLGSALRSLRARRDPLPTNLQLPWGEEEPAWRRWLKGLFSPRPSAPPPSAPIERPAFVRPQPVSRTSSTAGQRPERTERTANGTNSASGAGATAPADRDAPRIIGSVAQPWRLPVLDEILEDVSEQDIQSEDLRQRAQTIERTLEGFGLPVQVVEANQGPAVTQFGLRPGTIVRKNRKGEEKRIKVRVAQIQALANDLSLALAASPLRIEAPVPGRDVVGVEVPNVQIALVSLRGVMEADEFREGRGPLLFGLGRDVSGQAAVADLTRMPHMLIAGATGSGKSVCVNAIITALLLTHTPDTLRFLMIDPKRVELTVYNGIPHLLSPVVVDVERAVPVLQWATREMERRYKLFAQASARNIEGYNEKLAGRGEATLPYIVILIDELADLMLSAPDDVERQICRLAQMARATGMHLVIATQRPSVDVVTGLIKANFPARIAFAVTSQIDSRVILDTPGAEQLLGRGDMLFMAPDASKLQRLQGCYVSDRETQRLVHYWKGLRALENTEPVQLELPIDEVPPEVPADDGGDHEDAGASGEPPWLTDEPTPQPPLWDDLIAQEAAEGDRDGLYRQAVDEVRKSGRASVSLLQRRLRIGYSRAARLIDELETNGVIGPDQGGSRGRDVLPAGTENEG